jgi:hypothetical protein
MVAEACQLFDASLVDPLSELLDAAVKRSTNEEPATHVLLPSFEQLPFVDPPKFTDSAVNKSVVDEALFGVTELPTEVSVSAAEHILLNADLLDPP